jgi:hypothetical protein
MTAGRRVTSRNSTSNSSLAAHISEDYSDGDSNRMKGFAVFVLRNGPLCVDTSRQRDARGFGAEECAISSLENDFDFELTLPCA